MGESPFNVFSDLRPEVIANPELVKLILHLHNPEAWPLDVEQYRSGLSDTARALADEISNTYKDDSEFKAWASTLEATTLKVEREYSDSEPDED